jgi:drug/metabolite transporter (DMT)-like permease
MISGSRGSLIRMGLLALCWGSSFLWIKLALHGLSPVQITLVRLVTGGGLVLVLCLLTRDQLPRERRIWGTCWWPRSSATCCRSRCSASASGPSTPGWPAC